MRNLAFLLLTPLLILSQPRSTAAIDLQSHRAVYRMALANTVRASDVVSAEGVMLYRFARGCDGWTVENRTYLRMLYDDDREANTLWSFASWESDDGRKFRFHARYDQDGKSVEKLEGEVDLKQVGGAGDAHFTEPPDKTIALPAGTVFPTEHIREVLKAAQDGKHALNRVVFDGASLDNPYMINALFGPLATADADALAKAAKLPAQPSWWTRMAFFHDADTSELPEFEMAAQYRADGIADRIIQSFDTFALDVRLKDIELLPPPEC